MNLFIARIDQFTANRRIAEHVFWVRLANVMLLVSMACIDALFGAAFDFPQSCYLLVLCVILGLDIKTLVMLLKGRV